MSIDEALEEAVARAMSRQLSKMEARLVRVINEATGGQRLSLHQAADRMGIHYKTALEMVASRKLPAVRVGRKWLVDVSALPNADRDEDEIAERIASMRAR